MMPKKVDQEIQCELMLPQEEEMNSQSVSEYSFVEHNITVNDQNEEALRVEVNLRNFKKKYK